MAGNYVLEYYLPDQQPTEGAHNDIKGIVMLYSESPACRVSSLKVE